jgi:hypothetical protein
LLWGLLLLLRWLLLLLWRVWVVVSVLIEILLFVISHVGIGTVAKSLLCVFKNIILEVLFIGVNFAWLRNFENPKKKVSVTMT